MSSPPRQSLPVRILGVDPGSQVAGIAIIERVGSRSRALAAQALRLGRGGAMPERLARLFDALNEQIEAFAPTELAIESAFVARNVNSAMKLGQARGVVLCCAARAGLAVHEYAPRAIKLATVGSGRAEKSQVQYMMQKLFALDEPPPPDAADALAVALYHANQSGVAALLNAAAGGVAPSLPARRRRQRWVAAP